MRKLSEKEIAAAAPNAAALSKARKISASGDFLKRIRSLDESFYMGECKGSGKSNYIVSGDYIDEDNPVYRCTCPSRQFPCKHCLALMFEIAAEKPFEEADIPPDILEKRQKKKTREEKKEAKKGEPGSTGGEEKKSRISKSAKIKKIKKQLEGLAMMKKMTDRLLTSGLAAMGSVSLKNYKDFSKQLGDYYLPGPQILFNRLIIEMEYYQKDSDEVHYKNAVEALKKLRGLERKAKAYLEEKLEKDFLETEDDILYEGLGGIWKLEQLKELGLQKEDRKLVQLSFEEIYDEARKEYIDKAYWIDMESGEISYTANYRPLRALKYVRAEDSCFDVLSVPLLCYYPGGINKRIRWEGAGFEDLCSEDFRTIKTLAYESIAEAVKAAKNELKNILSDNEVAVLLRFRKIAKGKNKEGKEVFVAEDFSSQYIELVAEQGEPAEALKFLQYKELMENQAIFGKLYYDVRKGMIYMRACSIVSENGIVRLGY